MRATRITARRPATRAWVLLLLFGGCASSSLQACDSGLGETVETVNPVASEGTPNNVQTTDLAVPATAAPNAEIPVDTPSSAATPAQLEADGAPTTPGSGNPVIDPDPDLTPPPVAPTGAAFPLAVSDDRRHLVDQTGEPFLVSGDAAWSMLVQLDLAETDEYLARRQEQGYNTLLINLIEHNFSDDPPRNTFGDDPFLSSGDFARPNPAYFDAAHAALQRAADLGFLVLLAPAYLGYEGGPEGWYQDMVAAGPDALRSYGRFVGARFADLDNIIWVQGGDFTPPAADLDLVEAVRAGIVDSGAQQLHTAHWSPEDSSTDVPVDWLDLNLTYSYGAVHVASLDDDSIDSIPHLLVESQYEADLYDNTTQRLRCQAYEAVLTRGQGSVYGHGDIWQFTDDWRDALDAPGGTDVPHVAALLHTLRWAELVPDSVARDVLEDPGEFGSASFVTVAASPDRDQIVAYVPERRDVALNMPEARGTVSVRWFDPTDATFANADADLRAGVLHVEAPGSNGDGDADRVLVVVVS